jgi:hypothetical protein
MSDLSFLSIIYPLGVASSHEKMALKSNRGWKPLPLYIFS